MDVSREYKGIFWIPGEEENTKNGILKFLNGIAYIDLFGSFDENPLTVPKNRRNKVDQIFAKLDNQNYCIFSNCKLHISNPFFLSSIINFKYVIYSSQKELVTRQISIKKVRIKLDYLAQWVGFDAYEVFKGKETIEGIRRKEKEEIPVLYSNPDYRLKANYSTTIPIINPDKDYLLKQDFFLQIEILNDITIKKLFEFIFNVQDLLTLLIGDRVMLNNNFQLIDSLDKNYFCYHHDLRFTEGGKEKWNIDSMLFSLKELSAISATQTLFETWFSILDNYDYPLQLLMICLSSKSINPENKFINLMYALDVIQQKDPTAKLKETETISKKEADLLEKLEKEFRVDKNTISAVKARFLKKKNPKLKDKFCELLTPFSNMIQNIFGGDFNQFIELIVNTRNFLAHESDSIPKLEYYQYNSYSLKLEAVVIMIFLTKLGVEIVDLEQKIKHHFRYKDIVVKG